MLTGPNVVLALKVAVVSVTILLAASLTALALGRRRLHGQLNLVFFALSVSAVLGLEVLIRLVDPLLFDYFDPPTRQLLRVHLGFSIPATLVLLVMLVSGLRRLRRLHLAVASLFAVLWLGTLVTGLMLPTG
jgi:uncharacterized membrane protein YozB (DUF420 family)